MTKVKISVCEHVKEIFEKIYIESDISKSQNIFCECSQNTKHLILFSMCLRYEIGIEDGEFGLHGCFCSSLNSHENCDYCWCLKYKLNFKAWQLCSDKDIFNFKILDDF